MTRLRMDPPLSECATIQEIAKHLGCSDQYLYNLRDTYADFPKPIRHFGIAAVYWKPEVAIYAQLHRENMDPSRRRKMGRRKARA